MKKIISGIVIMIIFVLLINISCVQATTLENFKTIFNEIISYPITLKIEPESEGKNTNIDLSDADVEITDNKINIKDDELGELNIDYSIDENKCNFSCTIENVENIGEALSGLESKESMVYLCFITMAKIKGIDPSLAYTYMYQKNINNREYDFTSFKATVNDSVYKYENIKNGNNIEVNLEINLTELSNINEQEVDSSYTGTVYILGEKQPNNASDEAPDNEQNKPNESADETQSDEPKNNIIDSKDPNNVINNVDNTISQVILPKTGNKNIIIITIFIIILVGIYCYNRYKNMLK